MWLAISVQPQTLMVAARLVRYTLVQSVSSNISSWHRGRSHVRRSFLSLLFFALLLICFSMVQNAPFCILDHFLTGSDCCPFAAMKTFLAARSLDCPEFRRVVRFLHVLTSLVPSDGEPFCLCFRAVIFLFHCLARCLDRLRLKCSSSSFPLADDQVHPVDPVHQ